MASKDIKEEKKSTKKAKKEQAKVDKQAKKEKNKKIKKTKKFDTVVFVDNEEQANEILEEVMKGPVVEEVQENKKNNNFWSELKAFFLIIVFIGGVIGAGFIVFKCIKPFESKKTSNYEETKVTETNDYKTVVYRAAEGNRLEVINDSYVIEYKDNVLYKLLDMDGNVLFTGTEGFTDILVGIDDELYLTLVGADLTTDNASLSVYKFVDKELVEVFTAHDEGYLFTTLVYRNNDIDYLVGVVGESSLNNDGTDVETVLYTLDNKRVNITDVRLHGEDPFRAAVDEPIVTYNKDYVVVKDTNDEYKFGIYDIKNEEIVLNTKYDGLYTTSIGDYIAVKGKKTGLVNVKSKILIDFKYDFIYDAGSFYVVCKDKKLGILDNEFKEVIKPTFTFQQVGNAGFNYRPFGGGINSFDAYKYKDKYVLTINAKELDYDLKYKLHDTYVVDTNGEYLTIDSNDFGIVRDFIYSYDKDAKKYSVYDQNFAEKYTLDISSYDFEEGPYISLINDNTVVISLDTELYYDFASGEEIESIKDAAFVIDKIEFKYSNEDKEVSLKVNGELISTYEYKPSTSSDSFYYNIGDKMYYYVTNDLYVMVRKSE